MKYFLLLIFLFTYPILLFSCQHKKDQDKVILPRPDHIVIVIEENHGYDQIIGAEEAPYINHLAQQAAVFTDAHGVTHPSQPDYLALFSGSRQGVHNDHC
jgi:acid phosphatase